ncbi:MAG TPA: response regulator [Kiritimatiellia bacterium]|nr:response regulator [Kiritimatiellia bacterium]
MTTTAPIDLLIVEDNPLDLELILRTLRGVKLGEHCRVMRDGAEALDYLLGSADGAPSHAPLPRAVFLDLKLPRVDGLDVLKRLRGNARTRTLPVVVLTSSRELKDIQACYAMGVNSYIVKPVQFELFSEAVRSAGLYWLGINQPSPGGGPA